MPRDLESSFDPNPVIIGTATPLVIQSPANESKAVAADNTSGFVRSTRKNGSANRPIEKASFVPKAKLMFVIDSKDPDGTAHSSEIKAIAVTGDPRKPHGLASLVIPDTQRPSGMRTIPLAVEYRRVKAASALNRSGPVDVTRQALRSREINAFLLAKVHAELADSVWPKTPRGESKFVKPLP